MKYLIDNQLPRALVRHLQARGLESSHVADLGMDQASDREIWQYAATNGFAIVSKDEDFLHLSGADPDGPPFVWVRLGNCRKPGHCTTTATTCATMNTWRHSSARNVAGMAGLFRVKNGW